MHIFFLTRNKRTKIYQFILRKISKLHNGWKTPVSRIFKKTNKSQKKQQIKKKIIAKRKGRKIDWKISSSATIYFIICPLCNCVEKKVYHYALLFCYPGATPLEVALINFEGVLLYVQEWFRTIWCRVSSYLLLKEIATRKK